MGCTGAFEPSILKQLAKEIKLNATTIKNTTIDSRSDGDILVKGH